MPTYRVAGVANEFGLPTPSSKDIYAVSYNELELGATGVFKRRVLGKTATNALGEFTIDFSLLSLEPVIVLAIDNFGEEIVSNKVYNLTETIRPPELDYIGLVYRCTVQGNVGATFPDWSGHFAGDIITIGTAQFRADLFYQPLVHGVLYPLEV